MHPLCASRDPAKLAQVRVAEHDRSISTQISISSSHHANTSSHHFSMSSHHASKSSHHPSTSSHHFSMSSHHASTPSPSHWYWLGGTFKIVLALGWLDHILSTKKNAGNSATTPFFWVMVGYLCCLVIVFRLSTTSRVVRSRFWPERLKLRYTAAPEQKDYLGRISWPVKPSSSS